MQNNILLERFSQQVSDKFLSFLATLWQNQMVPKLSQRTYTEYISSEELGFWIDSQLVFRVKSIRPFSNDFEWLCTTFVLANVSHAPIVAKFAKLALSCYASKQEGGVEFLNPSKQQGWSHFCALNLQSLMLASDEFTDIHEDLLNNQHSVADAFFRYSTCVSLLQSLDTSKLTDFEALSAGTYSSEFKQTGLLHLIVDNKRTCVGIKSTEPCLLFAGEYRCNFLAKMQACVTATWSHSYQETSLVPKYLIDLIKNARTYIRESVDA